jgi:hypothetical protein
MIHPNRTGPDQNWTPCRLHLFEALTTVAPRHLPDAVWYIPTDTWEAIKKDPNLNGDWLETPGHGLHDDGLNRSLLGRLVRLTAAGHLPVRLAINVRCRPLPDRPDHIHI